MRRIILLLLLLSPVLAFATTQAELRDAANPDAVFYFALNGPLHTLNVVFKQILTAHGNPLTQLQQLGNAATDAADSLLVFMSTVRITHFSTVFETCLPFLYPMAWALWAIGFMLGQVLPMLPFSLMFIAGSEWVIYLIVCLLAAPFVMTVALTATAMSDEMPKKITDMLLFGVLNVCVRPVLIVLGMTAAAGAACALLYSFARIWLLFSTGFSVSVTGLITSIIVMGIFSRIVVSIVCHSFALAVMMPDAVMRFFGHHWLLRKGIPHV